MKKVIKASLLAMTLLSAQQTVFADEAPAQETPKDQRTLAQKAWENKGTIALGSVALAGAGLAAFAAYNPNAFDAYLAMLTPAQKEQVQNDLQQEIANEQAKVAKDQSILDYISSLFGSSAPVASSEAMAPAVASDNQSATMALDSDMAADAGNAAATSDVAA